MGQQQNFLQAHFKGGMEVVSVHDQGWKGLGQPWETDMDGGPWSEVTSLHSPPPPALHAVVAIMNGAFQNGAMIPTDRRTTQW